MTDLRIGYYRASDDSVSSSWWPESDRALRESHLAALLADPDVTEVWTRSTPGDLTILKGL